MKKTLLFIAFVFLASCGGQNADHTPKSAETALSSHASETSVQTETASVNDAVVGEKIAKDPGYMQCLESARYTCGVNFINAYATNNSDKAICEQFSSESLRDSCLELVITETAKKTLDETRCHELSGDKQAICVQGVIAEKGLKKGDPTVCSAYVLSSQDTDTLENMKDRCVVHIIDQLEATEKTWGLCGLIVSAELKATCETRVSERMGQATHEVLPPPPAPSLNQE